MEKIYRFGWYALILAMTGDILVSVVLPCLYEEYSSMKKSISALAFFVLFVMSDKPEFSNTIINNEGLWERLNLIFMYAPLLVVSIRQIIKG